jgi:hypothetical protein
MGEESAGLPNREPIGWYQRKLERLGHQTTYWITHLAGVEEELRPHAPLTNGIPQQTPLAAIASIRPRLQPRFRNLSEADLAISGFMLRSEKPPTPA